MNPYGRLGRGAGLLRQQGAAEAKRNRDEGQSAMPEGLQGAKEPRSPSRRSQFKGGVSGETSVRAVRDEQNRIVNYVFHVTPCPAPRMTQRDRWAKRPCVLRYYAFRDAVQAEAFRLAFKLPGRLSIRFILPMPPSWSTKERRLTDGMPHDVRPDLDNLQKAFLDAMASEDGYVWSIHAEKRWGIGGRIEIEIEG